MSMFGPYPGLVRDWHDGDTCHVDLDLGFGFLLNAYNLDARPVLSARIYGINAPELSTDAGKAALVYAQQLCPPGTRVTVTSHGWDKYGGRFDGSLTLPDGSDFGQAMIAAGQAVPYTP
jgi:endonuclease YncB( thermonuclease family)